MGKCRIFRNWRLCMAFDDWLSQINWMRATCRGSAEPIVSTCRNTTFIDSLYEEYQKGNEKGQRVKLPLLQTWKGYSTISFSFFNGRILTAMDAGLALNMVSSPVNGLMPLRAFFAGFLTVAIFKIPGSTNSPTARFLT